MNVNIKIKNPVLRCYLKTLFKVTDTGYVVSMESLTGAAVCSLVKTSRRPYQVASDHITVNLILPSSPYTGSLQNKHLYFTAEAEMKINATLKKEFDVNFISYCTELRRMGFKTNDIISMFILENNLDVFNGDIDTLKKKLYRSELKNLEKLKEKLRARLYYNARKIITSLK